MLDHAKYFWFLVVLNCFNLIYLYFNTSSWFVYGGMAVSVILGSLGYLFRLFSLDDYSTIGRHYEKLASALITIAYIISSSFVTLWFILVFVVGVVGFVLYVNYSESCWIFIGKSVKGYELKKICLYLMYIAFVANIYLIFTQTFDLVSVKLAVYALTSLSIFMILFRDTFMWRFYIESTFTIFFITLILFIRRVLT